MRNLLITLLTIDSILASRYPDSSRRASARMPDIIESNSRNDEGERVYQSQFKGREEVDPSGSRSTVSVRKLRLPPKLPVARADRRSSGSSKSALYSVFSNMLGTVANDENVAALANLFASMAVTAGITTAAEIMKQVEARETPCMRGRRVEP